MSALALINAVKANDDLTIEKLINDSIDIEQTDDYGWTALNWAAAKGYTSIVQQLLNAGANTEHKGRDQRTAYQIALAASHLDTAELLQQVEPYKTIRPYCKAYSVTALNKFSDWKTSATLDEQDIVFLHQDFSVTANIWHDQDVVFCSSSPEWEDFCSQELAFFVPSDLTLASAFIAEAMQS